MLISLCLILACTFPEDRGCSSLRFWLLFYCSNVKEAALDEKDLAMHAIRIPSVSMEQSTKMQEKVEKAVLTVPEVSHVFSKNGYSGNGDGSDASNVSDTFIMLKERSLWPDPRCER